MRKEHPTTPGQISNRVFPGQVSCGSSNTPLCVARVGGRSSYLSFSSHLTAPPCDRAVSPAMAASAARSLLPSFFSEQKQILDGTMESKPTTSPTLTAEQAFENTSTNVAASQMRNALNKLTDTVTNPDEKKVSNPSPKIRSWIQTPCW